MTTIRAGGALLALLLMALPLRAAELAPAEARVFVFERMHFAPDLVTQFYMTMRVEGGTSLVFEAHRPVIFARPGCETPEPRCGSRVQFLTLELGAPIGPEGKVQVLRSIHERETVVDRREVDTGVIVPSLSNVIDGAVIGIECETMTLSRGRGRLRLRPATPAFLEGVAGWAASWEISFAKLDRCVLTAMLDMAEIEEPPGWVADRLTALTYHAMLRAIEDLPGFPDDAALLRKQALRLFLSPLVVGDAPPRDAAALRVRIAETLPTAVQPAAEAWALSHGEVILAAMRDRARMNPLMREATGDPAATLCAAVAAPPTEGAN